jgi:uncharacterized membrane protein
MSSILSIGKSDVSYVDYSGLDTVDYVAVSISTFLFLSYYMWHRYITYTQPHATVASHVDFSRMSWTKHIYYDYKNRVITIQTFRSALLITRFYFSTLTFSIGAVALSAGGTNWWAAFRGPVPLAAARIIVPFVILFFSFGNLALAIHAMYYLHFHTQVEDLTDAECEKFGMTDIASDIRCDQVKACSAVLAMQSNDHFRYAWRSMVVGFSFMMWATSPYLMMLAALTTTISLYMNDFFFSQELTDVVSKRRHHDAHAPDTYGGDGGVGVVNEADPSLLAKRAEIAEVFRSLPS